MPDANTLTIGIFANLAQHERELISSRTKAALEAKKKQGHTLGKPENMTQEHRLRGMAIRSEIARSNENNRRAAAMIKSFRSSGMNWMKIASELNNAGFKTSRGKAFQAVQVQRIYNSLNRGTS
jgi:DNA invertase Pin-like site-specific DNA recombinase